MTEPKRWDATNCVRFCAGCDAEYGITAGADAGDEACSGCGAGDAPHVYPRLADFGRLRDERDRLVAALREIAAAGRSFDLDEQYPHHDPPLDNDRDFAEFGHRVARSALAVFDTLTEEKPGE